VAAIAFGYAGLVVLGGYATRVDHLLATNSVYLQHSGHVAAWMKGGLDKAGAEPLKRQLDVPAQKLVTEFAAADVRVEFSVPYLRGMGLAGNGCATQPVALMGVAAADLGRLVRHPEVLRWSPESAMPVKGKWMDAYPEVPGAAAVSAGLAALLQKPRVYEETKGGPDVPFILACDTDKGREQLAMDANVQVLGNTYDGIFSGVDTEMVATFHWPEAAGEDGTMYTTLATLQKLYDTDRVTYVALFLHRPGDAADVARDLRVHLQAHGLDADVMTYDEERLNPYYVGSMAFLGSMVAFITLLVVLVLILTAAGAMALAIMERTRELGTWRALGFGRGHLTGLMVREATLLALLGVVGGLALGLGAALGINHAGIRFSPPGVAGTIPLLIVPSAMKCALQAAITVPGVALAAWLVVRAQVKRNVVDLLTSQGA
jgi:putative ABC transport system permease protein